MDRFGRFLFTAAPIVIAYYLLFTSTNMEVVLLAVAIGCFVSHLKFLEDEIDKLKS